MVYKQRWKPNRPHWSYSQLSQFLRCPLQYYFERIIKLPRPFTPSGMALGSAVHHSLAVYHRSLQRNEQLSIDKVQTAFIDAWDADENYRPVQFRDGETRQGVLQQGRTLLETYLKELPPTNIVAVEEPLIVPLSTSNGEFLEKPLVAIVDLLCRSGDELEVVEFKTSGRKMSLNETETSTQASCYVKAVQDRYSLPASVRYTVLVKTKTPQVQHIETVRTDADIRRVGDIIQMVERAIDAEAFYPVESALNCSGCPFFRPCKEWRGTSQAPISLEPGQTTRELVLC